MSLAKARFGTRLRGLGTLILGSLNQLRPLLADDWKPEPEIGKV